MLTRKNLLAIGVELYGGNWIPLLAQDLQINAKDIENYINGNGPAIGKVDDISDLLVAKETQVHKLLSSLNELYRGYDARNLAIKHFKQGDASQLTKDSKVYCRLRFNPKGFYKADIQLQEPKEKFGWQAHQFDEKYFVRDLVNLDQVLAEKLQNHMAVVDVDLEGEESL